MPDEDMAVLKRFNNGKNAWVRLRRGEDAQRTWRKEMVQGGDDDNTQPANVKVVLLTDWPELQALTD
ncbi:hypothetical protein PG985_001549 [Apiospora marii]|uniref:uncharacterized protein n=1 Tax=Apiospora marii TaxID=335849 RepID=UPI00312D07B6